MESLNKDLPRWAKKLKLAHNWGIAFLVLGSLLVLAAFLIDKTIHSGESDQWPKGTGRRDWSTIEHFNNLHSTNLWYKDLVWIEREREDETINSSKSTLFSKLTHYSSQRNYHPQLKSPFSSNGQKSITGSSLTAKQAHSLGAHKNARNSLFPFRNIDYQSEKHAIIPSAHIKTSSMNPEQKGELPNEASRLSIHRHRIFSQGSARDSFSEDLEQVNVLPNGKRSRNHSNRSGSFIFGNKNRNRRSDEFLTAKNGSSVLGGAFGRSLSYSPHSNFKGEKSDEFQDCLSKAE